jgi:hypothetical protein
VRVLKIRRSFEVDLQLLRFHLRMVQEDLDRIQSSFDAAGDAKGISIRSSPK